MSEPWNRLASAAAPVPAQVLLGTELALLLAAVVALVSLERERDGDERTRQTTPTSVGTRSSDRHQPALITVFTWTSGATALIAAVIGAVALVTGHLVSWEKALVSFALVFVLAGVFVSYLSMIRTRDIHSTRLASWFIGAGVTVTIVTVAFLVVRSGPAKPSGGVTFPVYGTCLSGGCGLKQRAGPGPQYREVGPRLQDGTRVSIECRIAGRPAPGYSSKWWDRISSGSFVSDAFIDRPKDGRPPYIRLCNPALTGA
jgi:hypothetical protein